MSKRFLLIKDAAELLGVSKLTLRNWDNSGKLPAYRHPISNYRVYRVEDVENIIKKMESGEKPVRHKKMMKRKLSVLHIRD